MSIGRLLSRLLIDGLPRQPFAIYLKTNLSFVSEVVILGIFILHLLVTVPLMIFNLRGRKILRRKRNKHYSANSVVGMLLAEATVTQTIVGSLPTFSTK